MKKLENTEEVIDLICAKLNNKIVLGTPLAAGKPNHLINALYERAKKNPEIDLTICTALTLERPKPKSELEKRFLGPFEKRVFADYPDLTYELDRTNGKLPPNVRLIEFYFPPGKFLNHPLSQQNYISSNYTHVCRDMLDRDINLIMQMVAKKDHKISLSCNSDVTLDMIPLMKKRSYASLVIGQVNQNLPFMYGDAVVEDHFFDILVDRADQYYKVFGPPKMSITDADFMIGLNSAALVKDNGELQVGIGSLGDAVVYGILLKDKENSIYNDILKRTGLAEKFTDILNRVGYLGKFEKGLFGATEMMVDGFGELYKNGILKKKVYDNIPIQRLINQNLLDPNHLTIDIVDHLTGKGIITFPLSKSDFDFLQYWGILKEEVRFTPPMMEITSHQLGRELKNGKVLHAGFFLGPNSFYEYLRNLPEEERKLFSMKSVKKVNHLFGHEELDRLHRKNARFINTCMMTTLAGAHVSDGLEDGRVVSGVGGQFNFVSMAQELPDGHSILTMRATRTKKGKVFSNIVFNYGHITIPRHLRDILVTEYGIAYLRGKTDEEIIIELLKVCDSRFQGELIEKAKKVGKLRSDFILPDIYTRNLPQAYSGILTEYKKLGHFSPFPFGTDLTETEVKIGGALKRLKAKVEAGPISLIRVLLKALGNAPSSDKKVLLQRLELESPKNFKEAILQRMVATEL